SIEPGRAIDDLTGPHRGTARNAVLSSTCPQRSWPSREVVADRLAGFVGELSTAVQRGRHEGRSGDGTNARGRRFLAGVGFPCVAGERLHVAHVAANRRQGAARTEPAPEPLLARHLLRDVPGHHDLTDSVWRAHVPGGSGFSGSPADPALE